MTKLKCVSNYSNQHLVFKAGEEFEASDELASFLFADSPESFKEVVQVAKQMKAPPMNKAILEAPHNKAAQPPITSIDGVGPAMAKRLAAAGFNSVEAIAQADASELSKVPGVGDERAAAWIEAAKESTK